MKYNINYTEIRGFCKERYLRRYRENVGFRKINWSFLQTKENPPKRVCIFKKICYVVLKTHYPSFIEMRSH